MENKRAILESKRGNFRNKKVFWGSKRAQTKGQGHLQPHPPLESSFLDVSSAKKISKNFLRKLFP